jgi:hypothetical protein
MNDLKSREDDYYGNKFLAQFSIAACVQQLAVRSMGSTTCTPLHARSTALAPPFFAQQQQQQQQLFFSLSWFPSFCAHCCHFFCSSWILAAVVAAAGNFVLIFCAIEYGCDFLRFCTIQTFQVAFHALAIRGVEHGNWISSACLWLGAQAAAAAAEYGFLQQSGEYG